MDKYNNNDNNKYHGLLFATSCVVQTDLRSRSYWQQHRVQNEMKRKTTNGGENKTKKPDAQRADETKEMKIYVCIRFEV